MGNGIEYKLDEIGSVSHFLLDKLGEYKFWLFDGGLGCGKTTLIKSLCDSLGVTSSVSSPTFSIIHEYSDKRGNLIIHSDLYRVETDKELCELDIDCYFDSAKYCFIEWSSKFKHIFINRYPRVEIEMMDNGRTLDTRSISVVTHLN